MPEITPSHRASVAARGRFAGNPALPNETPLDLLDLSALPAELQGRWVFLRVEQGRQEVLASGDDIREVVKGQPEGPQYILTRVPRRYGVIVRSIQPITVS